MSARGVTEMPGCHVKIAVHVMPSKLATVKSAGDGGGSVSRNNGVRKVRILAGIDSLKEF